MLNSRNCPRLPTYAFAHAKTKIDNFDYSILELDSDIGIIFHVFALIGDKTEIFLINEEALSQYFEF